MVRNDTEIGQRTRRRGKGKGGESMSPTKERQHAFMKIPLEHGGRESVLERRKR